MVILIENVLFIIILLYYQWLNKVFERYDFNWWLIIVLLYIFFFQINHLNIKLWEIYFKLSGQQILKKSINFSEMIKERMQWFFLWLLFFYNASSDRTWANGFCKTIKMCLEQLKLQRESLELHYQSLY